MDLNKPGKVDSNANGRLVRGVEVERSPAKLVEWVCFLVASY